MSESLAIEEINKEIKDIVSIVENVALTATEALLESKQAGIGSAGFSMVARELRGFSENMAAAMQRLSGLINWQVEVNATKCSLGAGGTFGTVYIRGQADIDEIEQLIACQVCELQIDMMRTAKQCSIGLLIARLVGMEADLYIAMTPELLLITKNVEEVVGNIALRVRRLELLLAEAGLWKKNRLFGNPAGDDGYPTAGGTLSWI
jgi:hypothetical protein